MAKVNEKKTARFMYVEQGMDAKEIAAKLNVSENTLSKWVNSGWKEERDARVNSLSQRAENIKRVISNLTEQTLTLQEQRKAALLRSDKGEIKDIDMACVGIGDQISKYTKALMMLDKQHRITLDVYLEVMESIFNALQSENSKLFMQTLDFQEEHIQFISAKLG